MSTLRLRALALSLCFFAPWAGAVDYRSVGVPAAILYDAPSLQAKKPRAKAAIQAYDAAGRRII